MDTVSPEVRSRIMGRIKGKGTKPELAVAAGLRMLGHSDPKGAASLPGRPDFVLGDLCIFVHGCFWHRCPAHGKTPPHERWRVKLEENVRRDRRVRAKLRAMGYRTMVIWEHENPLKGALRAHRRANDGGGR